MAALPDQLAVFSLPNLVLYPNADLPLRIYDAPTKRMIDDALTQSRMFVVCQINAVWQSDKLPVPALYPVGTVALITAKHRAKDGAYSVFVHGLMKVRIERDISHAPYRLSQITALEDESELFSRKEIKAYRADIMHMFYQSSAQGVIGPFPTGMLSRLEKSTAANFMALSATLLGFSADQQQQLLELDSLEDRFQLLIEFFNGLLLSKATMGDAPPETDGEFSH